MWQDALSFVRTSSCLPSRVDDAVPDCLRARAARRRLAGRETGRQARQRSGCWGCSRESQYVPLWLLGVGVASTSLSPPLFAALFYEPVGVVGAIGEPITLVSLCWPASTSWCLVSPCVQCRSTTLC